MAISPPNPEYYIAEYNALTGKISHSVTDLHNAEVILASAMLLFYGWVFKDGMPLIGRANVILCAPVLLSSIAVTRLIFRQSYLRKLEGYARNLEKFMFSDPGSPRGWETWYAVNKNWVGQYFWFRLGVWSLVLVATVFVASEGPNWARMAGDGATKQKAASENWHGSVNCNWKVDK